MTDVPSNASTGAAGRSPLTFTLAAVGMTSVTYGLGRYAYGLFLPSIRDTFGLDNFTLGLIASLNAALYLVATVVASAIAVHFRPRTFIVGAGLVATLGFAAVGLTSNVWIAIAGIVFSGIGAGFFSPAAFEAIEAWLPERWKHRAIGAVNAGATPGLILTGLAAFAMESSWQFAWLIMAGIALVVTCWNLFVIPSEALLQPAEKHKLPIKMELFIRRRCFPLYSVTFVYGLLISVYLTFAVDLVLSSGGITPPADRLFWVLLGVAGLPTIFAGEFVARFGVRTLLMASIPLCGLSYALIAILPDSQSAIFLSAALFGVMSIVPGNGLLVWSMRLFHPRPSLGTGAVFFVLSLAVIIGPAVSGFMASILPMHLFFLGVAALSVLVLPLIPQDETDDHKVTQATAP